VAFARPSTTTKPRNPWEINVKKKIATSGKSNEKKLVLQKDVVRELTANRGTGEQACESEFGHMKNVPV